MAGQLELSRSCPGSKGLGLAVMRSWGPGDGAALCLEPQPATPSPLPLWCPVTASPVTPHLVLQVSRRQDMENGQC